MKHTEKNRISSRSQGLSFIAIEDALDSLNNLLNGVFHLVVTSST